MSSAAEFVMSFGNHTGNSCVNVEHHNEWNEEGTHRAEYDIAFVSVILAVLVINAVIVPRKKTKENGLKAVESGSDC